MLINQNHIPIGISGHQTCRAICVFIRLRRQLYPLTLQLPLYLPHIIEALNVLPTLIPTRIEGEYVSLEHALEQSNQSILILHDEVILIQSSAKNSEPEGFIKCFRSLNVFHAKAAGKCA